MKLPHNQGDQILNAFTTKKPTRLVPKVHIHTQTDADTYGHTHTCEL